MNNFDCQISFQADDWLYDDLVQMSYESGVYPNNEFWVKLVEPRSVENLVVFARFRSEESLNDQLQRLYLLLEAAASYSQRLTLVIPYLPYSLQDREVYPGLAVGVKTVAATLEALGVSKIVLVDPHCEQELGFFSIPVQTLDVNEILAAAIDSQTQSDQLVVIAPDKGARQKAENLANKLRVNCYHLEKKRFGPGQVEVVWSGEANLPPVAVLSDDILNTGGTMVQASQVLQRAGVKQVLIAVTHSLGVAGSFEKLEAAGVDTVFTTDSFDCQNLISQTKSNNLKIKFVSLKTLLWSNLKG